MHKGPFSFSFGLFSSPFQTRSTFMLCFELPKHADKFYLVQKVNRNTALAFKQMENIAEYLKVSLFIHRRNNKLKEELQILQRVTIMQPSDLFDTVELYEAKNMNKVILFPFFFSFIILLVLLIHLLSFLFAVQNRQFQMD